MPLRLLNIFALALLSLFTLSGCEDKLTTENYEMLAEGMSYDQVKNIMGEGKLQPTGGGASISSGGVITARKTDGDQMVYEWKDNSGRKIMSVTFQGDKMIQKSKDGF